MKSFKVISIAFMALAMLLTPFVGFAQAMPDPGPGYDIKIEYRYTEGEEGSLTIPSAITRFGRNYHLVDRAAPVLESSMAVTRNYTWYIEGVLTEEEKAQFENIEGVTLKPVEVQVSKIVDKTATLILPVNDVDLIDFKDLEGYQPGDPVEDQKTRTGVKFEEIAWEMGLPTSYKATVVYRGLETYMEAGYYEVHASYETKENIGSVPVYVVVATYAPDNPPVNPAPGGGGGGGGAGPVVPPEITPPEEPPEEPPGGGEVIGPEQPPTTNPNPPEPPIVEPLPPVQKPFNIVTLIPLFIAIGFAICCILLLQKERERMKDSEAKREARRKAAQRAHGLAEYD